MEVKQTTVRGRVSKDNANALNRLIEILDTGGSNYTKNANSKKKGSVSQTSVRSRIHSKKTTKSIAKRKY